MKGEVLAERKWNGPGTKISMCQYSVVGINRTHLKKDSVARKIKS